MSSSEFFKNLYELIDRINAYLLFDTDDLVQ